jgi:hypothetical protein
MTRRLTDEKFVEAMEYVQSAIFCPEPWLSRPEGGASTR